MLAVHCLWLFFSFGQAWRTCLLHTWKFLFPNKFAKSAPQRRRFTYITDVKCILAGSDKIRMIRRQGVPVSAFETSSLVQSLWGQKSLNATDTGSNVKINSFMQYSTAKVAITYTLERNLPHCTGGSCFWHESNSESRPRQ